MTWRDRYRQGSFRGVEFGVVASQAEFGRRTNFFDLVDDESGGSAYVDLGKAPGRYPLTVVFVGDNYDARRDAFTKALETEGPGELVHPYYGTKQVLLEGVGRITESTVDGGMATIEVTFRKYREPSGLSFFDTSASLLQIADLAMDAINADFVETFDTDLISDFVRAANLDVLDNVTGGLRDINNKIDAVLSVPGNIASDIDEFSRELAELISTPQKLINEFQAFVTSIFGSITRIVDAIDAFIPAVNDTGLLDRYVLAVTSIDTETRQRQRVNQAAIMRAAKGSALVAAARAFSILTPDSAQDALLARDAINTQLDALLLSDDMTGSVVFDDMLSPAGSAGVEETGEALRKLAAAVARHAREVAGDLPQLGTHTPAETLPAVVIAYNLYQDATRGAEIEDRNTDIVWHPLFVPGSVPIEVLAE